MNVPKLHSKLSDYLFRAKHIELGEPYKVTEYRDLDGANWVSTEGPLTVEKRTRILQRMQTTYPDGRIDFWFRDMTEEEE